MDGYAEVHCHVLNLLMREEVLESCSLDWNPIWIWIASKYRCSNSHNPQQMSPVVERKMLGVGRYLCRLAMRSAGAMLTQHHAHPARPGAAAERSEGRKRDVYAGLPSQVTAQYIFCPFAVERRVETMGTEPLAKKLSRASSGDGRETTCLIQRISLAIQRGNAASIPSTISPNAKFNDIHTI